MLLINKAAHAPLAHMKLPPAVFHMHSHTSITLSRSCTISAQKVKSVHISSNYIQSHSLQSRTGTCFYNHASGKYLFTQNTTLQTQRSGVSLIRCYSFAASDRNRTYGGCSRKLLTPTKHQLPVTIPQRHLSLAWVDSLALKQAGWFRALGESQFVASLMEGLQAIHDYSHLPWWSSIILSTILMRAALTFPLAVYQKYIFTKLENLKPEMNRLVKELKGETAFAIKKFNWDETHARRMFNLSAKRIWKELIVRENCHPFKATALLWVQIPLWICMSVSFRNMASMMPLQDAAAQILFLELSTGGIAWIPNLTDVDHSLILPVAMGLINLVITEVNVLSRKQETSSRIQKIATNFFRVISVAMIPIAAIVPSCVVLYWVTSSAYGLAQNLALMHPGLQRVLRLPPVTSQPPNPYQYMWSNLLKKVSRRKVAQD
ncbi:cytochrome c oxidase assembly protein COX18, mitochondrial-like isoform X1 [Eriocheir sinensis]|uniref:cytochrome c oxidase assembly protein COX18, mitochondrial-like isoform X1 n=2 Tax=Eriocheir sinensis TaxID=95602 RepID=UPI0021CABB4C|nr:cytochrome c oxidase assembly protein COX18, mitochondrial-like isoform X1 [Eriocheir sinensis]XP_050701132.1 cytochrome c oxidase assembly protein COX18, mitochondrial-like isoform X1 [Eriocheir sinensis]XP_050701133.1 cytochrome c oxidase assembly protein COX18, mitochondrial-like isoform X1 [Eriocheir sinensis]